MRNDSGAITQAFLVRHRIPARGPALLVAALCGCFNGDSDPSSTGDGTTAATGDTDVSASSTTVDPPTTATSTTTVDPSSGPGDETSSESSGNVDSTSSTGDTGEACVDPPAGIVAWWKGDGDLTEAVSGFDGIAHGSVAYDSATVGDGITLSGDDWIEVDPQPEFYPEASFSFEGWISSDEATGTVISLYECGQECIPNGSYSLYRVRLVDGRVQFLLRSTDSEDGSVQTVGGTTSIADGELHHFAAVKDTDAGQIRVYVDGLLDLPSGVAIEPTADGPFVDEDGSEDDITIGAQYAAGEGFVENHYSGVIDELTYYSTALTDADVAAIHGAGPDGKCVR